MKKIISSILSLAMLLSLAVPTFAIKPSEVVATGKPQGYVTFVIEVSTLGQGYLEEPQKIPFYEGDNYASLTTRLLEEKGRTWTQTGKVDSGFYLATVQDNYADDESRAVALNPPKYLIDYLTASGVTINDLKESGSIYGNELGEFDFHNTSGWMYSIAQQKKFPNVGVSDSYPCDGDVIRWQFTLNGLGADLGSNLMNGDVVLEWRDRDGLIAMVGAINSAKNKKEILAQSGAQQAYDKANEIILDLAGYTQQEIDDAMNTLNKASRVGCTYIPQKGKATVTLPGKSAIPNQDVDISVHSLAMEHLQKTLDILLKNTPAPIQETTGGDWSVMCLSRGGAYTPQGYYDGGYVTPSGENYVGYKKMVEDKMIEKKGNLHRTKYTEYSRLMLPWTALGFDPTNIGGYNVLAKYSNFNNVKKQGINGPVWALIALDTGKYRIDVEALAAESDTTRNSRKKMIEYILNAEIDNDPANELIGGLKGGCALYGNVADPDMTGMAIQALVPYYNGNELLKEEFGSDIDGYNAFIELIKAYCDRGVIILSKLQSSDGDYYSWGTQNVESTVQALVAITGLGIDPRTDSRFIKNGKTLIDGIMKYAMPDGGFTHTYSPPDPDNPSSVPGSYNAMATDQGCYGLIAYQRFCNGENWLYDMTDFAQSKQKVTEVAKSVTITNTSNITSDIALPKGNNDVKIYWKSSNPEVVSHNGVVVRPIILPTVKTPGVAGVKAPAGIGDTTDVTMTATIVSGGAVETKTFNVSVANQKFEDLTPADQLNTAIDQLSLTDDLSNVTAPFDLPISSCGLGITWSSSNENVIKIENNKIVSVTPQNQDEEVNIIAQMQVTDPNSVVGIITDTKNFKATVKKSDVPVITNQQKVANAKNSLTLNNTDNVIANLTLPAELDGTTIAWSSDKPEVITNAGVVTRPAHNETNATVKLTATISCGDASDTKEFTVTVLKQELVLTENQQKVELAKNKLTIADADKVSYNLTLPTELDGTTIVWSSDKPEVITNAGVVTRPAYNETDVIVKLTATISCGDATDTKEFNLTVLKEIAPPEPITEGISLITPDKISGKAGTQFNVVVKAGSWTNEQIKLIDGIIAMSSQLKVADVKIGNLLRGGNLEYHQDLDGKLRFAYLGTNLDDITLDSPTFPVELMTITLELNSDVALQQLNIKAENLTLKTGSKASPIDFNVTDAGSKDIEVVDPTVQEVVAKARTLYVGDGIDLISANQKAVAVEFTNLTGTPKIMYNGIELVYSQEITDKKGVKTYVAIIETDVTDEALSIAKNYTIGEVEANSIKFADTNNDNLINAQDALNTLAVWLRKTPVTNNNQILVMNVNADGSITTLDVLAIIENYVNNAEFDIITK